MLNVTLNFKKLNLAKTVAEQKEVYEEKTERYLVASTKSYNKLIEGLKAQNKIATSAEVEKLFLDRDLIRTAVTQMVFSQIEDPDIATDTIAHIMETLNGACLFDRARGVGDEEV